MKSNPELITVVFGEKEFFQLQDTKEEYFKQGRVRRILDRYQSYFDNYNELLINSNINYVSLQELIEKINKALSGVSTVSLVVSVEIQAYIQQNKYAINEQRIAGSTIKASDERWKSELITFGKILDEEITRPLKPEQLQASFYLATMKRAANFSVPGAGKTAMMYGAFAYLSSKKIRKIRRLLVVSPINAFEAWRTEYIEVFGEKRYLNYMNLKEVKYRNVGNVRVDWGKSDIIVINYEALEGKLTILNELIDEYTMIVCDEVHRVKGVGGRRATAALNLGPKSQYRYVLTGTPIPNSYKDIYNFLHLLYDKEYDSFFRWEVSDLENPEVEEINNRIQPFFWRTNKYDLKVPKADPDKLIVVKPSEKQKQLVQAIYENEGNILALYLRLLQASTNPALLLDKIEYRDLGLLDDEFDLTQVNALNDEEREIARIRAYQQLQVDIIPSAKFEKGIQLIMDLVGKGKKVIVWGMFVKTMQKIKQVLQQKGVSVNLVYGGTPKDERVKLINDFRDGEVEVMISNPNTLGESISLHQTVHDAIYFEYNFNLTFMLQSRDRIHRLGLKDDQYTRYYYLMTEGDRAHGGFIDQAIYKRLKEKEQVMLDAIDGELLIPEVTDDYLNDVKNIIQN
ncbi:MULTISPECIES: DEAD/DEAH box helicase [Bacillus cereus group]|jgi:superfamily II DNA or RNA helicase|nr:MULTISPECIES: DEAD/DEAH box helicase [Bacillus cereus group]KMQ27311.1 helicase [Bacillus cereus]KXY79816.1 helicase [Bacillus cereus]MCU9944406.1 DEAD/DEAH box helicase [Bacillus pacificus]MDA2140296.1 DEAD/DEAH box helicase [Bacillus cereus group sp. Bc256]OBZ60008.1 helicase [Bacillus cereus]